MWIPRTASWEDLKEIVLTRTATNWTDSEGKTRPALIADGEDDAGTRSLRTLEWQETNSPEPTTQTRHLTWMDGWVAHTQQAFPRTVCIVQGGVRYVGTLSGFLAKVPPEGLEPGVTNAMVIVHPLVRDSMDRQIVSTNAMFGGDIPSFPALNKVLYPRPCCPLRIEVIAATRLDIASHAQTPEYSCVPTTLNRLIN